MQWIRRSVSSSSLKLSPLGVAAAPGGIALLIPDDSSATSERDDQHRAVEKQSYQNKSGHDGTAGVVDNSSRRSRDDLDDV